MKSEQMTHLKVDEVVTSSNKSIWYHHLFDEGVFVYCAFSENNTVIAFYKNSSLGNLSEKLSEIISQYDHKNSGQWKILGDVSSVNNAEKILISYGRNIAVKRFIAKGSEILVNPAVSTLRLSEPKKINKTKDKLEKIRVMIVDDSSTIRKLLENLISSDPELEVVASVSDPLMVATLIPARRPDVITLDIHMPQKDGVTLLSEIYPKYKIPTLMVSALSPEDGPHVLQALELGAIDYIKKPAHNEMDLVGPVIIEKIRSAARANISDAPKNSRHKILEIPMDQNTLVAIGSSTGGTEALKSILTRLPANIPPIVITQHIPAIFSKALADRLNQICDFEVAEAKDGDEICPGRALIAPGGFQMRISNSNGKKIIKVSSEGTVNRHAPSVDVLFNSVAEQVGKRAIGIILTGMGADGAKGLLEMHKAGAYTIAQDEKSSVVFGMPKEAIKLGAASIVMDLHEMPEHLVMKLAHKKVA